MLRRTRKARSVGTILLLLAAALVTPSCTEKGADGDSETRTDRPDGAPAGQSDFLSADGQEGQDSGNRFDDDAEAGDPSTDGGGEERTVEEGDIYRVQSAGTLLNLNSYRGLQVLDISDPSEPAIVGRAQISGTPVEMYVVGERAYILMNNWRGYYGYYGVDADEDDTLASTQVAQQYGGVVAVADISDLSNPIIISQQFVPGNVQTSRLAREGDAAALYVVAAGYGQFEGDDGEQVWETRTYVRSFDLADGGLEPVSESDLGGYVSDIQATPGALLVARWNWEWQNEDRGSDLSIFDISDPSGVMIPGDTIRVQGQIQNKFNMHLSGDILRVVSGNSWRTEGNTNYVQTFDASDLNDVTAIDQATFGDGERLFATLFMEDRAFFVTYLRVDPFHAFEITPEGGLVERSEFIVSGWNDYFRPVFNDTRLIGIGTNDEEGRTMAVSLYDITDLDNANPLITRAEVDATNSWSEASWDDRAFSVVQDAVSVSAPDGTLETGLVLLPYTGYSADWTDYTASVQIFTFSDTTLTRRGTMEHGTQVRRSFEVGESTANLSEAELSLFDTADPDAPAELGRVELAPNYQDFFEFGAYGARVKNSSDYYHWVSDSDALPPTLVEIISLSEHPDTAEAVASLELPASASMYQVGELLVAITRSVTSWDVYPYETETEVVVVDLSDPTSPVVSGSLTTDALPFGSNYYGYDFGDCFDCGRGWGWGYDNSIQALDSGIVLPVQNWHNEVVGSAYTCNTYAAEPDDCWGEDGWEEGCIRYSGAISCTSLDEGPVVCTGDLYECSVNDGGDYRCEPIDAATIETRENCNENDRYRYWNTMSYHFLDLRDPSAPAVGTTLNMDESQEFAGTLVEGDNVYFSFRELTELGEDGRSYVRYSYSAIDASNPSDPVVADAVNVPGQLLAVRDDRIFTRDFVYGEEVIETSLAQLVLFEGRAYLQSRMAFPDQRVSAILLDEDERLFVTHQRLYSWWDGDASNDDWRTKLTIIDAADGRLDAESTTIVDDWASLQAARNGRALFQIPGGLLVVDAEDAAAPFASAWYPTRGWPREFHLVGNDVVFAAGRYGLYRFPFDTYNLLPPL